MLACVRVRARVACVTLNTVTEQSTVAQDGLFGLHKHSGYTAKSGTKLVEKSVAMPLKARFSPGGCAPQPRLELRCAQDQPYGAPEAAR